MKKYVIKVNGVAYEVEVEETGSVATTAPVSAYVPAAPAPAAPVTAAPAPAAAAPAPAPAAPAAVGSAGNEMIKAPMPGTILSVQAAVGQAVKKNDVLCILEAMKMENEIVAPRDGVVAGISTSKGASVNAGDPLVSLE
ncbi:MAG: biotin/lipoyl-containing protein [Clostridiaceae bacterium]|nr:biotin/lipoyl-containing protein [Clostridiaceae bacterium]